MVAGIILAAGASSRMGRVKALLPSGDGRTFLERLAAALADAAIAPIVVVVAEPHARAIGDAVRQAGLRVELAVNPDPGRGQLSSLVAGLEALAGRDVEAVVATPVDYPLVRVATVRQLVDAWRASGAPVTRPRRGAVHGHPVVFDAGLFDDLRSADPSLGARAVIARHLPAVFDVAVDDPGAFEDVDTPDDYRRLIGSPLEER